MAVADSESNFVTGGQNNYGGYSSEVVDGLYDQLKASTDADEQQQLILDIEKELWTDAFGVTLVPAPRPDGLQQQLCFGRVGDPDLADRVLELLGVAGRLTVNIGDAPSCRIRLRIRQLGAPVRRSAGP